MKEQEDSHFENRIGSERVRLRKSQKEIAKQFGVTTRTVSNWENNPLTCSPTKLSILADFFECTVDYLLGRTKDRTKEINTGGC